MYLWKSALICLSIFAILLTGCSDNNATTTSQEKPKPENNISEQTTPSPTATNKPTTDTNGTITSSQTKITGTGPSGEGIKAFTNAHGRKLYSLPSDSSYNKQKDTSVWFFTEQDAQDAGYKHAVKKAD